MTKARVFLLIDGCIGAAFLVGVVSAIAFLVPFNAIDFATSSTTSDFLGVQFGTWETLHRYAGIVMIAGCFLHIGLHWRWLARTTAGLVPGRASRPSIQASPADVPAPVAQADTEVD